MALAACGPKAKPLNNSNALESAIDRGMGGIGTCVVLLDAKTGATIYQYNSAQVCRYRLPPCETFNIVTEPVGLDQGVVTPTPCSSGTARPAGTAWQTDADIAKAYSTRSTGGFSAGHRIGHDRYATRLAIDYGNGTLRAGWRVLARAAFRRRPGAFHAPAGGVSPRLYAGKMPVKPETSPPRQSKD